MRGLPGRNCAVENTPGGRGSGEVGGGGRGRCFKWGQIQTFVYARHTTCYVM